MSLENKLLNIKQQVDKYRNFNYNIAVKERLSESLSNYIKDVDKSYIYLEARNSLNVLSKICKSRW